MATTSTNEMILIMGDVHIPTRINSIPPEIKTTLKNTKSKFNKIICTGNYGNTETHTWLKSLLSKGCENNFYTVKTEDKSTSTSPSTQVITSNEFKLGVINGFQLVPWSDLTSLSSVQKQLNCDILIHGHTHIKSIYHFEGKWYINPGSISGAFSALRNNPSPSFMIIVTVDDVSSLYTYELNQTTKAFDIERIEITKS